MTRSAVAFALALTCVPPEAAAARQLSESVPDTVITLPGLEVRAARMGLIPALAPVSLSTVLRSEPDRNTEPAIWLYDVFREVPGLQIEPRGHLALGERIVIRGMGGRAAFGVRGIQILLDGVPLTMPDGQAITDIIDPAMVRAAEIIRGPSGRLWGNGSGGVLALQTLASASEPPGVHVRGSAGAYGHRHLLAEAVVRPGKARLHVYGSRLSTDGYRQHSAGTILRGGFHAVLPAPGASVVRIGLAGADQDVEHPGSLTGDAFGQSDPGPAGADPRYVNTLSGKRSRQGQAFIRWAAPLSGGVLETDFYGVVRDLDNPLPFAWIGLDRRAGGARVGWTRSSPSLTTRIGFDTGVQRDDRINANNEGGARGADTDVDQRETVRTAAIAAAAEWTPSPGLGVSGGLRVDRMSIRLSDRFLQDGDESGVRRFTALSPGLSIRWGGPDWTAFAGWSTAFDLPTTTEFVNSPDGSSAFNPDVGPQRTRGFETGFRTESTMWSLDLSIFRQRIRDLLSAFQDAESGRTYFDNVDRAVHRGVEARYVWMPSYRLRMTATAAWQRFVFDGGVHDGNALPGLPGRRLDVSAETGTASIRGRIRVASVSDRFGDDANEDLIPGYTVIDVHAFHRGIDAGTSTFRPFVAVRNVFDRTYSGSVVVNARGGRYFEPAQGRHLVLGLSARLNVR